MMMKMKMNHKINLCLNHFQLTVKKRKEQVKEAQQDNQSLNQVNPLNL